MSKLKITQVRSTIHCPMPQKKTVEALGLRHIRQTVEHQDNPAIRGMVNKVKHLVRMEVLDG
ncbi:MAG: 50S ribosomal protein L30 [bacterium]|nr:50S ribosomal protein L30 [bacterium]